MQCSQNGWPLRREILVEVDAMEMNNVGVKSAGCARKGGSVVFPADPFAAFIQDTFRAGCGQEDSCHYGTLRRQYQGTMSIVGQRGVQGRQHLLGSPYSRRTYLGKRVCDIEHAQWPGTGGRSVQGP